MSGICIVQGYDFWGGLILDFFTCQPVQVANYLPSTMELPQITSFWYLMII